MCIAIPMQVQSVNEFSAACEWQGEQRTVDTLLLSGELSPGDWVLVFHSSAREKISEERAQQVSLALRALDLAMQGDPAGGDISAHIDALFPDLPHADTHRRGVS